MVERAMSRLRSALVLTGLLAIAMPMSGCAFLKAGNVFVRGPSAAQIAATKTGRIAVVTADQAVTQSPALAGKDFALPPATALADWPLPGGTPAQAVEHVEAAPRFQQVWAKSFGKASGGAFHVTAPPVAAAGRIYVMDAAAGVRALDAHTGATVWRVNLQPKLRYDTKGYGGGVAYADGKLYVTSGFRFVAALDAATGKVIWRTTTDGPIHSAPTVGGGRVFAIDNDNQLLAVNAGTGLVEWNYAGLSDPARILAASSPALVDDTVVAAFSSGEVVRLRAATGAEIWQPTSIARAVRTSAINEIRDIAGRPVVYQGKIYASGHSGVTAAADLVTGDINWSLPIASITTPWAAGDALFVTSQAGQVICISRTNGDIYWIRDLNAGAKPKDRALWTGPVLASGRLIVASSKGRAVALDPKTGVIQKTIRIGGSALISPIAVGGMVYIVTDQARLVAIG
ncbi:MAG: dehydrogenase [Caulobacteraceae bacterium]|nr:dehydrogenase [Caulobacteraceae bacterium]